MFHTITSGALHGLCCYLTYVEVDTSNGLPVFDMVGFLSSEVKEARERVRVALKNTGITIPPMRITVNLSPANIKKEGTAFDLPIAIGIMTSLHMLQKGCTDRIVMVGELGLDGSIRSIKGVLPITMETLSREYEVCMVPYDNYGEGICVEKIRVYGVQSLQKAIEYLKADKNSRQKMEECQKTEWENQRNYKKANMSCSKTALPDFSELQGQEEAKRAATIAAAGFHHLLMVGPPGAGKTMIAKRMQYILPPLTQEESMEVSRIFSIAGLLDSEQGLIKNRPFYNPHHTITEYAMAGGGRIPRPGIISLAHRGLLFLDELPEFRREVIEIMRQPLEDKEIHIARTTGNYIYPASFLLVAAMNPCPCGYYPDRNRCRCSDSLIKRYLAKISGPILDRIDMCITTLPVKYQYLTDDKPTVGTKNLAEQVTYARNIQAARYHGTHILFNGDLKGKELKEYCPMTKGAEQFLEKIFKKKKLSARSYQKIIKVARTIADLEAEEILNEIHISEAVLYQNDEWMYTDKEE